MHNKYHQLQFHISSQGGKCEAVKKKGEGGVLILQIYYASSIHLHYIICTTPVRPLLYIKISQPLPDPLSSLPSYSKPSFWNHLLSPSPDNIIKVWRLYPFAQEALAPLMSFYCGHTPSFMTTIKSSMGVAFQDPSTATFSVVLYSLPDKSELPSCFSFTKIYIH